MVGSRLTNTRALTILLIQEGGINYAEGINQKVKVQE